MIPFPIRIELNVLIDVGPLVNKISATIDFSITEKSGNLFVMSVGGKKCGISIIVVPFLPIVPKMLASFQCFLNQFWIIAWVIFCSRKYSL